MNCIICDKPLINNTYNVSFSDELKAHLMCWCNIIPNPPKLNESENAHREYKKELNKIANNLIDEYKSCNK